MFHPYFPDVGLTHKQPEQGDCPNFSVGDWGQCGRELGFS
jgi:hypothetical protein